MAGSTPGQLPEVKSKCPSPVLEAVGTALAAAGIGRDTTVLAGISGGLDSMVLLDALQTLGQAMVVVHLDHRLRGKSSTADAKFVREACGTIPCVVGRRDVAAMAAAENLSIESAGRLARRMLFARVARRHKAVHLLLAHHADDQAETVLWNMLRGSGLAGASGMSPAAWQDFPGGTRLHLVRPLLHLRRGDLESHAAGRALVWREDASNNDPSFTRNRMRHVVMPVLTAAAGRDAAAAIARFATIAGDDNALLDQLAADALTRIIQSPLSLDLAGLRALPLALRRRVVVLWLATHAVPSPTFDDITRILAVITNTSRPSRTNLPANHHVARRAKRLWLEPPLRTDSAGPWVGGGHVS